ncbi:Integrin-alpha FG-GAP repeat-containing protein 2 [Balamuthia mandrillaris]
MKNRDLGILFLSAVAILLSFQQQSYFTLRPTWIQPIDTSHFANGHFPAPHETLPVPIVADIDGDGANEIVYVTPDYRIRILEGAATNTPLVENNMLQELPIKAEATLVTAGGISSGSRAVAMATGYLEPFKEGLVRKQSIVVVTNGWGVMLFDSNLRLIWESNVRDDLSSELYHSEVAITVAPFPVRVGDKGVVVVGGRLERRPDVARLSHELRDMDEEEGDEDEEHFSYYAFDGRTGALRWKHEAGDFFKSQDHQDEEKTLLPEHSYKLHVIGHTKHLGELDWKEFKQSVLQNLPHAVYRKEEASFALDHFERQHHAGRSGAAASSEWKGEALGIPSDHHLHIAGLPFGGYAPHTATDFIKKPNVVVAHLKSGLEVVHLYTGKPLCELTLGEGLHLDINGDGVIDTIKAVNFGDGEDSGTCYAFATSGIPPMETLFNTSICQTNDGFFGDLFAAPKTSRKAQRRAAREAKGMEATNPVALQSPRSLMRDPLHSDKDIVFLVSSGKMTSLDNKGRVNWQVETSVTWGQQGGGDAAARRRKRSRLWGSRWWDPTYIKQTSPEFSAPVVPSLTVFHTTAFGEQASILAVADSMVIVSADGDKLAEAIIEGGVPIAPPTIADFNNDGLNDIIIVTANAYYGYALEGTTGSILFPSLVGILLFIMLLLGLFSRMDHSGISASPDQYYSSNAGPSAASSKYI